jgi:hypothetical protein
MKKPLTGISWPITAGQAPSGPSRGICRAFRAASDLAPTSSTLRLVHCLRAVQQIAISSVA